MTGFDLLWVELVAEDFGFVGSRGRSSRRRKSENRIDK